MPGRRLVTSSVPSDPSVEAARVASARSELDLLLCLQYAPEGVLIVDPQGRVVAFNHTAEALWNRPRTQVLGRPLGELADAEVRDDFLAHCLHDSGSGSYELLTHDYEGAARWLAVSAARAPQHYSQLQVLFVRDISAQRARDARMRLLSLALDSSDAAIIVCDPQLNILYVNAGFSQLFGYAESEVLGHLPSSVLTGPSTDMQTVQHTRERVRAGVGHQADILAYRKDGTPLWATLVATPIAGEDGSQQHYILSFTDITQSKMHEVLHKNVLEALVREQPLIEVATLICKEVERIAPELMAAIVSVDGSGCLQPLAAPSMPARFGETMSNMHAGPRAGALATSIWRGKQVLVLDPRTDPLFANYMGLVEHVQLGTCVATPIKSSSGRVLGSFALCYRQVREPLAWHLRLIELCVHLCALALEREQTRARVHQLAFYDSLTGLPNRVMFSARAEQALAAAEHQGTPVAILFVDIDRFKRVNETQGHAAGDGLLRDIARRICDTLGVTDLVGRQAGDEFVLMLPHCSAEHAAGVAERLLLALAEPVVVGQMTLHPSASIGVAMFPEDGSDIETLLRHAVHVGTEIAHAVTALVLGPEHGQVGMAQERVAMETALREALHRDRLQLHYQPQLESQAPHALYGVEALLRWDHPNLGAISPARFVPMAEECGLIDELGHWVLREACRQMADWRLRGVPVPRVAVNLSANNFADPQLPARVQGLLAASGLQPADLALEMTESVMLSNPNAVLANLRQLQASGVLLSLDDFGTGYSSLSHLHQLPVNELKLDMSFVSDLAHCQTSRTLTTSVLRIGETLGLHTVAEGVETEAQRAFLARLGCRVLQGFLFAPALPAAALEHWLHGRASAPPA